MKAQVTERWQRPTGCTASRRKHREGPSSGAPQNSEALTLYRDLFKAETQVLLYSLRRHGDQQRILINAEFSINKTAKSNDFLSCLRAGNRLADMAQIRIALKSIPKWYLNKDIPSQKLLPSTR